MRILVRPVLPQDLDLHRSFFDHLSKTSRFNRYFNSSPNIPSPLLERLTLVDHSTHLALVAEVLQEQGEIIVAEARYVVDEAGQGAEFAIAVADDLQRLGLGTLLLTRLREAAIRARVSLLYGQTLVANSAMVRLARRFGFSIAADPDDGSVLRLTLPLKGIGTQAFRSPAQPIPTAHTFTP
jgi:acetyltransferase